MRKPEFVNLRFPALNSPRRKPSQNYDYEIDLLPSKDLPEIDDAPYQTYLEKKFSSTQLSPRDRSIRLNMTC